jgi:NAD-dependent deacetylase
MIPDDLVKLLAEAENVAVLTGAGVSAESGLPTFRDAQTGLWSKFSAEDIATPAGYRRNPALVWKWYAQLAHATPNPAHLTLAELEKRYPHFALITQNIDNLHQKAGSRNIIELHGNATCARCLEEDTPVNDWSETGDLPPKCPRCGAILRPGVVWFGEHPPETAIAQALSACRQCEVFLSIGTSTVVYPAASLPFLAKESGAKIVEINTTPTALTPEADYVLCGPAGTILPELLQQLPPRTHSQKNVHPTPD